MDEVEEVEVRQRPALIAIACVERLGDCPEILSFRQGLTVFDGEGRSREHGLGICWEPMSKGDEEILNGKRWLGVLLYVSISPGNCIRVILVILSFIMSKSVKVTGWCLLNW